MVLENAGGNARIGRVHPKRQPHVPNLDRLTRQIRKVERRMNRVLVKLQYGFKNDLPRETVGDHVSGCVLRPVRIGRVRDRSYPAQRGSSRYVPIGAALAIAEVRVSQSRPTG